MAPAVAPVASAAVIVGLIDPAWAPAANTALIVILALLHGRERARVKEVERKALDAKKAAGATRRNNGDSPVIDTGERRRWTDKEAE